MSSREAKQRRVLSDDERVLWMTVTRSIAPLRAQPQEASEDTDGETLVKRTSAPAIHRPKSTKSASKSAPTARLSNAAPPPLMPLGRRTKQRVARGKQTIDASLDLHGLTQAEAYAALLRFLRTASARGVRLVLVITGKGAKNFGRQGGDERGVLRRQVPQWLGMSEFRSLVIGFEDAHAAHGGEGALYVRVRRV